MQLQKAASSSSVLLRRRSGTSVYDGALDGASGSSRFAAFGRVGSRVCSRGGSIIGFGGFVGANDVLRRLRKSGNEALFFATFLTDAHVSLSDCLREFSGVERAVEVCPGAATDAASSSPLSLEDLCSELFLRTKLNDAL